MRDYKLRKKVFNDYATKEDLENAGGGGGALVCHILGTGLDTKWSVINQAFVEGKDVLVIIENTASTRWSRIITTNAKYNDNSYQVLFFNVNGTPLAAETDSPDGYPAFSAG